MRVDRTVIAHGLIIVSLCFGGQMMFVQPLIDEARDVEAELAPHTIEEGSPAAASMQAAAARLRDARQRLESIRDRSRFAENSSALYELIMDLAAEHELSVQRVQPAFDLERRAGDTVAARRVDVTMTGGYAAVAGFLEAIDGADGFIRPVSVSLTPQMSGDAPVVAVRFAGEALSFAIPETLTPSMEASADARP